MKLPTPCLPMCYERNSRHYENEKLPALYEIFHKKHRHFTHHPAGNCLSFIIKVVATSPETSRGGSSPWTASPSASVSKPQLDVQTPCTPPDTRVQVVESLATEPSSVLLHRKLNPLTPYNPDAWLGQLKYHSILDKYPSLYEVLAVPPLFLQESGHSGGMKFSRGPC